MARFRYTRYREAFLRGLKTCQKEHNRIETEADIEFNIRTELKKEINSRQYIAGNTRQACRIRGMQKHKKTYKNEYIGPDLLVCKGDEYLCMVEIKNGSLPKVKADVQKFCGHYKGQKIKKKRTVWEDTWAIGFNDWTSFPRYSTIENTQSLLKKKMRVMVCGKLANDYNHNAKIKINANNFVLKSWWVLEISTNSVMLHLNPIDAKRMVT